MVTVTKQLGNTRIIVHSPSGVIAMSEEEQSRWFSDEWERGNPVVRGIMDATFRILDSEEARSNVTSHS